MITKDNRLRSKKYRALCKGQECKVRCPGICNFDSETTIPAHQNGGGGMKHSDFFVADCCSTCHTYVDTHRSDPIVKAMLLEGILRTQAHRLTNDLIEVIVK